MYLHEYQSKQTLARFGIPTPAGKTAESPEEAARIAAEFGVPVVVNAQALDHQRVFRLAQTPDEAAAVAAEMLAMTIADVRVRTILIEPATDVSAEYFLGIYGDRSNQLLLFASSQGGSDIREIEQRKPQTLMRETINPFLGVLDFQARNLASGINLPRESWNAFTQIAQNLHRCCVACDAVRAEINPLGLTRDGSLIALGGKLVIDDNALFRQPELAAIRDVKAEHESAVQAREAGIAYVKLNGDIGCVVSGAGLGMATIDLLAASGREAASFLDLGSNIRNDTISAALRLILPDAQAVLFNIFADKAPCDEVARELIAAIREVEPAVPLVIRLAGRNADEGQAVLNEAGIARLSTAGSSEAAVAQIAAVTEGSADGNSGR